MYLFATNTPAYYKALNRDIGLTLKDKKDRNINNLGLEIDVFFLFYIGDVCGNKTQATGSLFLSAMTFVRLRELSFRSKAREPTPRSQGQGAISGSHGHNQGAKANEPRPRRKLKGAIVTTNELGSRSQGQGLRSQRQGA